MIARRAVKDRPKELRSWGKNGGFIHLAGTRSHWGTSDREYALDLIFCAISGGVANYLFHNPLRPPSVRLVKAIR